MPSTVAQLCQERGIDLAELVRRCGLDELRVAAIMQGRWTPSPSERKRVAGALEVAVEEIAWGHVTPIQHIYGHGPQ
jgi:transcriptional regulator with XRE-family HTH domain